MCHVYSQSSVCIHASQVAHHHHKMKQIRQDAIEHEEKLRQNDQQLLEMKDGPSPHPTAHPTPTPTPSPPKEAEKETFSI